MFIGLLLLFINYSGTHNCKFASQYESLILLQMSFLLDAVNQAIQPFEILLQEGEQYAKENGLVFLETSAKTAQNVNELFYEIGTYHIPYPMIFYRIGTDSH